MLSPNRCTGMPSIPKESGGTGRHSAWVVRTAPAQWQPTACLPDGVFPQTPRCGHFSKLGLQHVKREPVLSGLSLFLPRRNKKTGKQATKRPPLQQLPTLTIHTVSLGCFFWMVRTECNWVCLSPTGREHERTFPQQVCLLLARTVRYKLEAGLFT